jgi:malonate transporter and related proteins
MLQTLAITGPIYLVIALGFLAGHFGVFSKSDIRVLGTYVAKFALPALIFTALSQRPVSDILNGRYVLDYAVGSLAVMLIAFAWGWWRQGKSFTLSALCGLGMSSSNSGFIGLPIAVQVVGPASATVALAMCMVVENLLMIPLTLVMADSGDVGAGKWYRILMQSLGQLARNPVILAIIAGFGVALLAIPISGPLASTINMLALSSAAVSLFVIGGSLVGLQVKGLRRDVSAIALGKLLLHPLAVGLMVWLVPPADAMLRAAAVVFAGVPMLSIYPILAQKYGFEGFCAAALLLATVLSFVTISVILWLLGSVLGWTT